MAIGGFYQCVAANVICGPSPVFQLFQECSHPHDPALFAGARNNDCKDMGEGLLAHERVKIWMYEWASCRDRLGRQSTIDDVEARAVSLPNTDFPDQVA
jgi:hypothetical protein